ncbi:MAG: helix-turn-helix domain-containing protein [Marinilabiliaceae bacterium]|jgi:AraC-like DNA-binding protein|nr:helix-turn-helix domain-containing protein [Marinilabiliaceae bacterium]
MKIEIAEPSDHLKPYIRYYKYIESKITGIMKAIPIMHEELYFNFTHINIFSEGYYDIDNPKILIVGLQQYNQDGYTHMFGNERGGGFAIVFQPQGFYRLFNIKSSDLCKYAICGKSIFNQEFNLLHEELQRYFKINDMKEYIEKYLSRYARYSEARSDIIQRIINYIERRNGMITISHLCQEFNTTPRAVQRKFRNDVGLSIIELSHIFRINRAISLLNSESSASLAEISYLSGYYDQAHFTNDIKKITGITPGKIQKHKNLKNNIHHNRFFIESE